MKTALALAASIALVAACDSMPPERGLKLPPGTPADTPLVRGPSPGASFHAESTLRASDGTALYEQVWRPRVTARGVVVIVHGLRDHSGRYAHLAKELTKRGFTTVAADLRGHGRSQGPRVYVDRFDRYVEDLSLVIADARAREPREDGAPFFLMGHSMGGAIAALYAERPTAAIDGLILSAPAIKQYVDTIERCGANLLADLSPFAPRLEIPMEKWSRDPKVIEANRKDPLVSQRGGPISTAVMLLDASDQALADAPFIRVPTVVFHGKADGITDPAGSAAFISRIRSSDKTLKLYDKLFHDLWNEPERDLLTADLVTWLDAHATNAADDDQSDDGGADTDGPDRADNDTF